MPATIKYGLVDGLKEKLSRTKAVFVGEYRGMTVDQSTALRHKVREAGGELKVAKNTLFLRNTKEIINYYFKISSIICHIILGSISF